MADSHDEIVLYDLNDQLARAAKEASREERAKEQRGRAQRHAEILDATRRPNGTWETGVSGNREGPAKAIRARQMTFAKAALAETRDMGEYLEFLLGVGRDEIVDADGRKIPASMKERIEAWKEIANRTLGKAPDIILTASDDENPFAKLTVEELRALATRDPDSH